VSITDTTQGGKLGIGADIEPYTQRRSERGFSLLELTVSFTVLVVGLLPISMTMLVVGKHQSQTEIDYRLSQIAANRLETLQAESATMDGYVNLYPRLAGTFPIAEGLVDGLLIDDVAGTFQIVPGDQGASGAAMLLVRITYSAAPGETAQVLVGTVVNKDM
jgi:hypothetical protein